MIKKIISFVCCLLPVGAGAVVVNPEVGQNSVSTEQSSWTDAISAGSTITINSANVNGINSQNGFAIADNMFVGMPTDQGSISGSLYVLDTVQNPFTVVSTGDVSIGSILQVLNGKTLGFKTSDSNPTLYNLTVGGGASNEGIKIGDASQTANLNIEGVDKLTVAGSVIAYGNMTANVNSMDAGLINANAGVMDINAKENVEFDGLVANSAGDTSVVAGGDIVSDGTVQNNNGKMMLSASGNIEVSGNVENKSTGDFEVVGQDFAVDGTMTNESTNATTTLNVDSWSVDGGSLSEYSFVNMGNMYATVKGNTYFKWGMNLSGMGTDNVFNLDTGTLTFGDDAPTLTWFNAFSNYLDSFSLAIRDGNVDVTTILNGLNVDGQANVNANMSVLAENVNVGTVRNEGQTLVVKAADLASGWDVVAPASDATVGNITVTDQVVGGSGTSTDLIASGGVTVAGAVSNNGKMTLNGNSVNVASVSNSGTGAELTISSLTAPSGSVSVSGNVTNSIGTTTIWAKDVSVGGMITNNSGTTEVRGSDTSGGSVQIGAINAAGGVVNLNALAGSVGITNTLTVAGGTLNLGDSLANLSVDGSVQVAGDVVASNVANEAAGNLNVAHSGTQPFVMSANAIQIDGDIIASADDVVRNVQFDSALINVVGGATVANKGMLTLGMNSGSYVKVGGDLTVNDGGVFESVANDLFVGSMSGNSKFIVHGANLTADAGNIDIDGNLYFDPASDPSQPENGLVVKDTNALTIKTTGAGADISVAAVSVGAGKVLTMNAADEIVIGGVVTNNGSLNLEAAGDLQVNGVVTNTGNLEIGADNVNVAGVTNSGTANLVAADSVDLGNVANTAGSFDVSAADTITVAAVNQTGGVVSLATSDIDMQSLVVNGAAGTQMSLNASDVSVSGNVNVSGDVVQGGTAGMLNLNATDFAANNLTLGGDFIANSGNTTYEIGSVLNITGDVNVADGATSVFNVGNTVRAGDLTNAGNITFNAERGLVFGNITNDSGVITIDSGAGVLEFSELAMNSGNLILDGAGLAMTGAINTGAMLYQNYADVLTGQDINIVSDTYEITTAGLNVSGIDQDGQLAVNTSDVNVSGNIVANDLSFFAQKLSDGITPDWMNVNVGVSVSGDVDFIGLEKMTIGGDYMFNDGSRINAAILPYTIGDGAYTTDINYWASVSLNDDNTLGQITNPEGGQALITVGGKFESDLHNLGTLTSDGKLSDAQIGIDIFDMVDQGTAIWFLHANEGVKDLATKIRNLNVSFCNADGSLCFDYLDSITVKNGKDVNGSDEELPAYIAVRDSDHDGSADSLYIVFDPRFGGPVEVFKIQPIVGRQDPHTMGEYVAAGALDNMIAGQLVNKKFFNKTPIEAIPLIFDGTNLSTMANELYNRMEDYSMNRDGEALARFSRLFQVRELEQIVGAISLNEHTSFRNFEDRMFDEFIWNRNRNLKKAWVDVDFGMAYQNIDDGKHADGHRFSIAGGFDWQESNTLVLGLTGRVSRTSFDSHDSMDLSYAGHENVMGDVKLEVSDTNIGVGGYLMKILNEKARLYGNAFLDAHILDVDRFQTFMNTIDGDGSAFSLISEWGLMHDILNQYVVGNLYARAGYNFGFDVKEKAAGSDYMRLESNGYFILTPGYSLMAQKRIYPSAWLQIRPYASVGIEYDLAGTPNDVKYKFVVADEFTHYDAEIDPLWANIGAGVEMLSANGLQFGLDYRYQYNDAIQLHNIKISGSYRF
ncbi:MAG: hypothetical protein IKW57_00870 [Alphaproteobacteria bacterium]|nr:hypothetical protein [Alphaproteobacteria bacterium]